MVHWLGLNLLTMAIASLAIAFGSYLVSEILNIFILYTMDFMFLVFNQIQTLSINSFLEPKNHTPVIEEY